MPEKAWPLFFLVLSKILKRQWPTLRVFQPLSPRLDLLMGSYIKCFWGYLGIKRLNNTLSNLFLRDYIAKGVFNTWKVIFVLHICYGNAKHIYLDIQHCIVLQRTCAVALVGRRALWRQGPDWEHWQPPRQLKLERLWYSDSWTQTQIVADYIWNPARVGHLVYTGYSSRRGIYMVYLLACRAKLG